MQVVGSGSPDGAKNAGLNLSENQIKGESVSDAQSIDVRADGDS